MISYASIVRVLCSYLGHWQSSFQSLSHNVGWPQELVSPCLIIYSMKSARITSFQSFSSRTRRCWYVGPLRYDLSVVRLSWLSLSSSSRRGLFKGSSNGMPSSPLAPVAWIGCCCLGRIIPWRRSVAAACSRASRVANSGLRADCWGRFRFFFESFWMDPSSTILKRGSKRSLPLKRVFNQWKPWEIRPCINFQYLKWGLAWLGYITGQPEFSPICHLWNWNGPMHHAFSIFQQDAWLSLFW